MKESYYFPHDYNARNDQKILMLRSKFGLEGYALFWMCIESMAEETDGHLNSEAIGGLSISYNCPIDLLHEFIDYCVEIGLFIENYSGIYSKRLLEHKSLRKQLSDAGKKGAKKRWGDSPPNSHPYAKERKGKEKKRNKTYSSNNQKESNYEDYDMFQMDDGTIARMYYGVWVDDKEPKIKINRGHYKECPPNNK